MLKINIILFDGFEALDVFGPVEIFGRMKDDFSLGFYSGENGIVRSNQDFSVITESFDRMNSMNQVLFIPGGPGMREAMNDIGLVNVLKQAAEESEYVLTVCTGSILFSKTGLLDGKKATSNKRVFHLTSVVSPKVNWVKRARWIKDGRYYTSSGVSAGIDMTLGFVSDILGEEAAKKQSIEIEYNWNNDNEFDPFSEIY